MADVEHAGKGAGTVDGALEAGVGDPVHPSSERPASSSLETDRTGSLPTARVRADARVSDPIKQDHAPQQQDDGASKPPAANLLRRHPWVVAAVLVAIAVAGLGGFIYWQYAKQFEETDDAFIDLRAFDLAPKVSGYIDAVLVTDNQQIAAGATVFRIDQRDYLVALEQAQAQVQSSQATIENYDAQIAAQGSQIEQAAAQVEQADAALRFAKAEFNRYQALAPTGVESIQRSQQATSDKEQRAADYARAKAAFAGATQQISVLAAQRKGAIASLSQARAQFDQANLNLSYTTVRAAQAGRITKLSAAVGQYVQPGTGVAMFVPEQIWVTANFKETQLEDMRPNQPVTLSIDAYPAHLIRGRVASIQSGSGTAFSLLPAENATGNYVKVVQRVPVKIVVDEWPPDLTIGPGMSVIPTVKVLDTWNGTMAWPAAFERRALAWLGWGSASLSSSKGCPGCAARANQGR